MTCLLEHWKPVLGYEGIYEVSNCGNVRRLPHGRLLKLLTGTGGYRKVNLWRDGRQSTKEVHVLLAEAFLGKRAAGIWINHKNLNRTWNRLSNLEFTTPAGNTQHYWKSEAGRARTTPRHFVAYIRANYHSLGPKQLAAQLGMNRHTVKAIGKGKRAKLVE